MTVILREDQVKLKSDVYNSWNAGNRNVLAVANTGFGKSVVMSDIVLDFQNASRRATVIAHRNELVTQMSGHLAKRGIHHRIIGSDQTIAQVIRKHKETFGRSFVNHSAPSGVIGVDTLKARKDDVAAWCRQIDLWGIDEAHHTVGNWYTDEHGNPVYLTTGEYKPRVTANKWGAAVQMFPNALGMGFTATPSRADGQGLGWHSDGVFHDMVQGPSMRWLIGNNNLSDYELVCPTSDLKNIENEKRAKEGDWTHQAMRKAVKEDGGKIIGNVVENYIKYAYGRKAIVFATDIETAEEMAQQFNMLGIRAASVNGKSSPTWREQSLRQFSTGEIRILINVDLFDEGFDCPDAEVCIMARPTASLGKYLQMVGRVLRYVAGKVALIIDHVSNIIRHGFPDKLRIWTLDRREKRAKQAKDPDEIELTVCQKCDPPRPYEKFRTCCPYCGAEKELPEPRSRSVDMVEGDLILLDRETLERMRAAAMLESAGDVSARVAYTAGPIAGKAAANRQQEKIIAQSQLKESIAQWAAFERLKGYDDREIHKKFYLTTGVDVLTALGSDNDCKKFEEMNEIVKGWYS